MGWSWAGAVLTHRDRVTKLTQWLHAPLPTLTAKAAQAAYTIQEGKSKTIQNTCQAVAYLFLKGRSNPSPRCCGNGKCRERCWGPGLPEVGSAPWSAPSTSLAFHLASPAAPLSAPPECSARCCGPPWSPGAPRLVHTLQTTAQVQRKKKKKNRVGKGVREGRMKAIIFASYLHWQRQALCSLGAKLIISFAKVQHVVTLVSFTSYSFYWAWVRNQSYPPHGLLNATIF